MGISLLRFPPVAMILLATVLTSFSGCASFGPKTVPVDHFNYNAAIAETSHQQLLMNLVRLRYSETPVFLKVSSVISQYSRVTNATLGVGSNTSVLGGNTANANGTLVWADRPTISYTPLSGQDFSRNLLTPIPPSAVFEMQQAGWPATLVLGTTIFSINGIDSYIARPSLRRQAEPELLEMYTVWRALREQGVIGVRRMKIEDQGEIPVLYFREGADSGQSKEDVRRFRELLGLDPAVRQFRVVYGLVPQKADEIAVLTGSVWDIMLNISWQFEVPSEHISSGRTEKSFRSNRPDNRPPIQVAHAKEKPRDAFIAVYAQDYWFYIAQNDRASKRIFSFLELLLSLTETTTPDNAPVFTISN